MFTLQALIAYLILGLVGGTASEQVAKRKFWPPVGLIGAILVGFGGALIGVWLLASVIGWKDPTLFDVIPIFPALIGAIIFLIPWFILRSGRAPTEYSKTHTWQTRYRR